MNQPNRILDLLSFLVPIQTNKASSARQSLQRLLLLRGFVTLFSVAGLLIFLSFSSLAVPLSFITALIIAVLISIAFGYWRLKKPWAISNTELFIHLLVDAFFLIILLFYTGGVSNPLISYLLVLLAVTATLLPRSYVYSFALGSILVYSSFLLLDLSVEHDMSGGGIDQEMTFQLHLIGMWVIFLVSAILIAVFITRMASAIQVREMHLARARENEMRDEQLVAIGTLAAGTAHALGTPLSTMSVLLTDLDKLDAQQLKQADIKEDITLLRQQVSRCKDSLTQLIRYYHKDNAEIAEQTSLADFVSDIKDYIVNIHPSANVEFSLNADPEYLVASDLSVRHAVINIIENGIKAATARVLVEFEVSSEFPERYIIRIQDDGPGIPTQVMERMGQPFISMRKESMGLGIFLANAAVQRLGGSIEMFNLRAGGAMTIIKLPLHPEEN